ncbi:MAG: hypothetical protein AAFW66_09965, partial [Pseudomonadota bacterium]
GWINNGCVFNIKHTFLAYNPTALDFSICLGCFRLAHSLILAGRERSFADAVMAFSPGEYFPEPRFVTKTLPGITVPVFLTAARSEAGQWQPFVLKIKVDVTGFVPEGRGRHGATALVSNDREEYWEALRGFLNKHLPAQ